MRARWGRYLALAIGIYGVIAISWGAVKAISGLPYSAQQLEHATTVIGAPPGFSAGPFVSISDAGFGGPSNYAREFYGNGSMPSDSVYSWYVSRLTAMGLKLTAEGAR